MAAQLTPVAVPCVSAMAPTSAVRAKMQRVPLSPRPVAVTVLPCVSAAALGEIRGRLRKMDNSSHFLFFIFDQRDKQLYPHDLLVATVQTKSGKQRAVGFIRRSLKFEKKHNCSSLYIEFVWVYPECRGQQLGRTLLHAGLQAGKPKDVRLVVAGSVDNLVAIRLYESVGFRWTDSTCSEMLLTAEAAQSAVASYVQPVCTLGGAPSSNDSAASDAITNVASCESIPDMLALMAQVEQEQAAGALQAGTAAGGALHELGVDLDGGEGGLQQEAGGR